jgi:hypothetical protein
LFILLNKYFVDEKDIDLLDKQFLFASSENMFSMYPRGVERLPDDVFAEMAAFLPSPLTAVRCVCRDWDRRLRGWEAYHGEPLCPWTPRPPPVSDWSAVRRLTVDWTRPVDDPERAELREARFPAGLDVLTVRLCLPQPAAALGALAAVVARTAYLRVLCVRCDGAAADFGAAMRILAPEDDARRRRRLGVLSLRWGRGAALTDADVRALADLLERFGPPGEIRLTVGVLTAATAVAHRLVNVLLVRGAGAETLVLDVGGADDTMAARWYTALCRLRALPRVARLHVLHDGRRPGLEGLCAAPHLRDLRLSLAACFHRQSSPAAFVRPVARLRSLRVDVDENVWTCDAERCVSALRAALSTKTELESVELCVPAGWLGLARALEGIPDRAPLRRVVVRTDGERLPDYDFYFDGASADNDSDGDRCAPGDAALTALAAVGRRFPHTLARVSWVTRNLPLSRWAVAAAGLHLLGGQVSVASSPPAAVSLRLSGSLLGAAGVAALLPVATAPSSRSLCGRHLRRLRLDLDDNRLTDAAVRAIAAAVAAAGPGLEDVRLNFDFNPRIVDAAGTPNAFLRTVPPRLTRLDLSFRDTGVRWADGWVPPPATLQRLFVAFTTVAPTDASAARMQTQAAVLTALAGHTRDGQRYVFHLFSPVREAPLRIVSEGSSPPPPTLRTDERTRS